MARPGGNAEDDGWLLSVVYESSSRTSYLAILDAKQVAAGPLAKIRLPHHVPLGAPPRDTASASLSSRALVPGPPNLYFPSQVRWLFAGTLSPIAGVLAFNALSPLAGEVAFFPAHFQTSLVKWLFCQHIFKHRRCGGFFASTFSNIAGVVVFCPAAQPGEALFPFHSSRCSEALFCVRCICGGKQTHPVAL